MKHRPVPRRLWSALLCAALPACIEPSPATTTTLVPIGGQPCPLDGMPFVVSETQTKPEATLCDPPSSTKAFLMSPAYGGLNLTQWLANKDVDALSFGLDWVATQVPAYWRMQKFVSNSPTSFWEGWGAILYGDHENIHAYAWGDPVKVGALSLSLGHQPLHDMPGKFGINQIDAIDFNAWAFSGPPSALCFSPHPPQAGEEYDPTLIYSIPGPPGGGTSPNDSGATLWGVKAVEEKGDWAWHGPFLVAAPGDLGLRDSDDIDTLAFDRRQGLLMFSLTTTSFLVMRVEEQVVGDDLAIAMLSSAQELETPNGVKFSETNPIGPKPTTGCAIDPSKFHWRGSLVDGGAGPKEAQANR